MKCIGVNREKFSEMSLPVRGAWIEIHVRKIRQKGMPSLPVRGAWIEIVSISDRFASRESLPVRGAWIEIKTARLCIKTV